MSASEEPSSQAAMMKAITKGDGSGVNIFEESKKTFSMASGKNQKGDVLHPASDLPGALDKMKVMVEEAKSKASGKGGKKLDMWNFRASPHAGFGKTIDDTFSAFLLWGRTSYGPLLNPMTQTQQAINRDGTP